ncbi:hypothetical protein KO527_20420, partial [Pseudoalteromonas sp. C2R02]|uniref:beta strand repeat-containing protein n=1 Tax=Pseudoalteromonas sp. C2R02 TaxID=2841565 RepID=UPI001C0A6634
MKFFNVLPIFKLLMLSVFFGFCSNVFAATFSAVFTPDTIGSGNRSILVHTITNSTGTPITDMAFTGTLPVNTSLATPVIASSTCTDGTLTAVDGGSAITISDMKLAGNSSCTITVTIVSSTVGTHTYTTGDLTSSEGNSGTATDDLTVDASKLGASLSVDKVSATVGENIRLTLAFDNTLNVSRVGNVDANFSLPNGLEVSDFANVESDCGSANTTTDITSTEGSTSVKFDLSGNNFSDAFAILSAGASCSASLNLKVVSAGVKNIITGDVLSDFTSVGSTSTTLTASLPFLNMWVEDAVTAGSTGKLNFTINNFDRTFSATDMSFSLDLDSVLSGLIWNNSTLVNQCGSGLLSGSGTGSLSFSGGNLEVGSSCTFSLDLIVPASATPGSKTLIASPISVTQNGTNANKNTASSDLIITGAPSIALTFLNNPIAAGDTTSLQVVITDTAASAVTDTTFTLPLNPVLPFPTSVALPPSPNPPCGVGSSLALNTLDTDVQGIVLTGGSLAANGSCTFTVDIPTPQELPSGDYTLSLSEASSTVSAATVQSPITSASFNVVSGPRLLLEMPVGVKPAEVGNATFTLTHSDYSGIADATNISFTLDLDNTLSGLTATNLPLNDVCGSGSTLAGSAGDSFITLSGGTLSEGQSCSFTTALLIPDPAAIGSHTGTTSSITATVGGLSVTTAAISDDLIVSGLEASLELLSSGIPGGTVIARYTFNNTSPIDVTGLWFTHSLTSSVTGMSYGGGDLSNLCGTGSNLTGTTSLVFTGGNLVSGDSCTFDLEVLIPGSATYGDYGTSTSNLSYTAGAAIIDEPLVSTLKLETPLQVTKTFVDNFVAGGTSSDVTYELTNIGSDALTSIAFTDDFDSALSGSMASISTSSQCGGTLSGNGFSTLTYSAGALAIGETCTITSSVLFGSVTSQQIIQSTSSSITGLSNGLAISADAGTDSIIVINSVDEIVISIGSPTVTDANTGPVSYVVTYTNADSVNLIDSKVNLITTGTAAASISVTSGSTTTPTVTLSNITGDGTLAISIDAGTALNNAGSSIESEQSTSFNVDNTQPQVAISATENGNTQNTGFTMVVNFTAETESMSLTQSDFSAINASLSSFSVTNGNSVNVTVTPLADGPVTVTLAENTIADVAGNGNAEQSVGITFDNTKPPLSMTSVSNTNAAFTVSFDFNEAVTGFDLTDISVINGSANTFDDSAAPIYTALITPSAEGDVTVSVASDIAVDTAANGNTNDSIIVNYDTTEPDVTISGPPGIENSAFTVTITFTEDVTGFDVSDIVATNASLSDFSATSAKVYTVLVTPSSSGTVALNIAADVAVDSASNGNAVAAQYSVEFDGESPSVEISGDSGPVNSAFTATITFTEDVTGFELSDISATNAVLSDFNTTSAQVYTALVTPSSNGSVLLDIA